MSNENIVKMVGSLADGDNVAAQDAFKSALTDKIGQALDDKRQTVAQDWLNAGDDFEAVKDAAGLDDVGMAPVGTVGLTGEPIEIDDNEAEEKVEQEDEQPAVQEV
jgi:hypothetical protein